MSQPVELTVDLWSDISQAFVAFFGPLGTVSQSDEELAFAADDTGLILGRDGTSRSFMPLHELGTRWDRVAFDAANWQVVLSAVGIEYVYRVPPRLIPD